MVEAGTRDLPDPTAKLTAFFESKGVRFGTEGQVHLPAERQKIGGRPVS